MADADEMVDPLTLDLTKEVDPHEGHDWRRGDYLSCEKCKAQRDKDPDVCRTPQPLANAIIWRLEEVLELDGGMSFLEPSAGEGAFVRAIRSWSETAHIATFELRTECAEQLRLAGANDISFLNLTEVLKIAKTEPHAVARELEIIRNADVIPGNPPFGDAEDHIRGLLKHMHDGAWLAFLLRLGFYGAKCRLPFWELHPERYMLPISPRPGFKLNNKGYAGSDSQEYGVFVFQKGWRGTPSRLPHIIWDKPSKRRLRRQEERKQAQEEALEDDGGIEL